MAAGLTFVIYQMTSSVYHICITVGRSKSHFASCHHFTPLSPMYLQGVALLMSAMYWDQKLDQNGVFNLNGVLFVIILQVSLHIIANLLAVSFQSDEKLQCHATIDAPLNCLW